MAEFLHDAAERIIIMKTVHKKVIKRFRDFLGWMGIAPHLRGDFKPHLTRRYEENDDF